MEKQSVKIANAAVEVDPVDLFKAVESFARSGEGWTAEVAAAAEQAIHFLVFSSGNPDKKYDNILSYTSVVFSRYPVETAQTLLDSAADEPWLCEDGQQWRSASKVLRRLADLIDECEDESDADDAAANADGSK